MLTRRVHGRQFRLRPSDRLNHIIKYTLAVTSKRYEIRLHAVCFLSNHWHGVFTDPQGNTPEFSRDLHSLISRQVNCNYGDFESMWANTQSSHVECGEPGDIVRRIAYTMANPVEANLVRYGHNWPGVRMCWPRPPQIIERPKGFFRDEKSSGKMPAQAVLEFHRPPGYDHLSDEELDELLDQVIKDREQQFRDKHDKEGKKALGRRAVLKQSRYASPTSRAPRFGISPRVGAQSKWRRIEMINRNREWQSEHEETRQRWRDGDMTVVFPYGTYKLRIEANVRCAPPPT